MRAEAVINPVINNVTEKIQTISNYTVLNIIVIITHTLIRLSLLNKLKQLSGCLQNRNLKVHSKHTKIYRQVPHDFTFFLQAIVFFIFVIMHLHIEEENHEKNISLRGNC